MVWTPSVTAVLHGRACPPLPCEGGVPTPPGASPFPAALLVVLWGGCRAQSGAHPPSPPAERGSEPLQGCVRAQAEIRVHPRANVSALTDWHGAGGELTGMAGLTGPGSELQTKMVAIGLSLAPQPGRFTSRDAGRAAPLGCCCV